MFGALAFLAGYYCCGFLGAKPIPPNCIVCEKGLLAVTCFGQTCAIYCEKGEFSAANSLMAATATEKFRILSNGNQSLQIRVRWRRSKQVVVSEMAFSDQENPRAEAREVAEALRSFVQARIDEIDVETVYLERDRYRRFNSLHIHIYIWVFQLAV